METDPKKEKLLEYFNIENSTNNSTDDKNTNLKEYNISAYDDLCEENSMINKIIPVNQSLGKYLLYLFLNIITLFLMPLVCVWYPNIRLSIQYSIVNLNEATHLCIFGKDGKIYYIHINNIDLPDITNSYLKQFYKNNINSKQIKVFQFKLFNYYYNAEIKQFTAYNFNINTSYYNIHSNFLLGLNSKEVEYQTKLYGECDLNFEVDSVLQLLFKEFSDPFYLFQVFSVILWMNNGYEKYATIIIISTVISLSVSVLETRENLLNIQQMAKYSCEINKVVNSESERKLNSRENFENNNNNINCQEREIISTSSKTLIPGDVFEIPEENFTMPCDAILISGTVIINESMLTGESVPIIKAHIPNTNHMFNPKHDHKYILYAGTKVIQKRSVGKSKVLGVVLNTGFNTEKGNLIRSIIFPKESEFNFKTDSVKYIYFMACLSIIGFSISLPFLLNTNMSFYEIIVKALDLVTTTVPPALPACIGIGITYSLSRLKEYGIICINRERVNMAGKVDMICFDKTGTLTEDHLDIYGYRGVKYKKGDFCFDKFTDDIDKTVKDSFEYYKQRVNNEPIDKEADKTLNLKLLYSECLATCHSITKVNGKLIGDPIDIKMFDSTGWILNEDLEEKDNYDSLISTYVRPGQEKSLNEKLANIKDDEDEDLILHNHYEIGIVRRFDFSSKLQRMSVLVKNSNEPYYKVFAKGSPEKIKELCIPESVPEDFSRILSKYTTKGFRVLALAVKKLKMNYMQSQKLSRETAEEKMIYLGLLIVQNQLKSQTIPSIETLSEAGLKMIMATGDNIFTAISVAKECSLIIPDASIYMCEIKKEKIDNVESSKLIWSQVDNFIDEDSVVFDSPEGSPVKIPFDSRSKNFSTIMGAYNYDEENLCGRRSSFDVNDKEAKTHLQMLEGINLDVIDNIPNNWNEEEDILALTGTTFETLLKYENLYLENPENPDYYNHHETFKLVLKNGYIFARMSPENKTQLVESLKKENFTVCMCGDGANDCGALKAADVGLSLSIEEASIAAHFTSNVPNISALINLFREGKASLVTSIQCFMYMMLYSLIQFISVTLLMIYASYLTDNQFLCIDLFLIFPLAILMARTTASPVLTHHQPTGALISVPIIISILLQTLVQFLAQFGILLILCSRKWYVSVKQLGIEVEDDFVPASVENTSIFLVSWAQYLTCAIIFSIGGPFKNPIHTNYLFCGFLILSIAITYFLIIAGEGNFLNDSLSVLSFKYGKFNYVILVIILVNFLISYVVSISLVPCLTKFFESNKDNNINNQISKMSKLKRTEITLENFYRMQLKV